MHYGLCEGDGGSAEGMRKDAPPDRAGGAAERQREVAKPQTRGGVVSDREKHLRTPPRLRERMLRGFSFHASCPSCVMQEGRLLLCFLLPRGLFPARHPDFRTPICFRTG